MNCLYSAALSFYYFLIFVASHFNKKAKLWIEGRVEWKSKLVEKMEQKGSWIWFHCSSLGEFEDCCEVFFKIQKEFPYKNSLLTVFSPSAFEVLKDSKLFDFVCYLPLDKRDNAKVFVEIVKPELVIFSRSELWLNFLSELRKRKIPLYLVSLRLSTRSNFLKWPLTYFYKQCFESFNHIYCQNELTKDLLKKHFKILNTTVTGNTRFERVYNQSRVIMHFPEIISFIRDSPVIILGSCLPEDERLFLEIYDELKYMNIKWIVVPHEMNKSIVQKQINSKDLVLYSSINELNEGHAILLIDSVGILKYIYAYADLALIGGGFDRIGIHNIIEPAVYGVPVAFGPNHRNYMEAVQLISFGGASIYRNSSELKEIVLTAIKNCGNSKLSDDIMNYVKRSNVNSSIIVDTMKIGLKGSLTS